MRPPGRRSKAPASPSALSEGLVEIGRIVNRHGIRGEVRLMPHNPATDAALWLTSIRLVGETAAEERKVIAARVHKRFILLQLEGITTADQADSLVGRAVCVRPEQMPPLAEGEVYHADLIDCAVSTESGEPLGTVREVISTGSNDVCVVVGGGREYLIPLIADAIARLDVGARVVVVRPLPGLLDP